MTFPFGLETGRGTSPGERLGGEIIGTRPGRGESPRPLESKVGGPTSRSRPIVLNGGVVSPVRWSRVDVIVEAGLIDPAIPTEVLR